jgi:hypothetical protein
LDKLAGSSIAGVKSILKSAELNIIHFGVCIDNANVSGILWFTLTNSMIKHHNVSISFTEVIVSYFISFKCTGSSKDFLINQRANGVACTVGKSNSGKISLSAHI